MTHEELLADLKPAKQTSFPHYAPQSILKALITVIELHKPDQWDDCSFCKGVRDIYYYPCPTIEAIQEQLK